MNTVSFIVTVQAPDGVAASEIADHLADASRLVAAGYDVADPLSGLEDVVVHAIVDSRDLRPNLPISADGFRFGPCRILG